MIIYKITNKLDGKIWIGQTVFSLEERWSRHCSPSSGCRYLKNAIKKYGKENFSVETVQTYSNLEDLNNAEIYFIEYYNCIAPNGYNLRAGGGNKGKHHEETKRRMSAAQSGENHAMFGKHHSGKTIQQMSDSHKGIHAGEKHPMFGKFHTEETKLKISAEVKQRVVSEETRKKMSEAQKGKKKSPEAVENNRKAQIKAAEKRRMSKT